eukprot:gene915-10671_t
MKNETRTEIGLGENFTSTLRNFTNSVNGSLQPTTPFIMELTQPRTSKYQRILLGLLERKSNITNETDLLRNQSRSSDVPADKSQKVVALTVPLVLLGVFLVLVVICHRIDTIRSKRRNKKQQMKASKGLKCSETEQAVEEVGQDVNRMLLIERHKEMMRNRVKESIGKLNHGLCQEVGEDKGRCMCRLKRCAHCLGYEAKRIQWQANEANFDCKNAATQTWLPMHCKLKTAPQSSHKDGSVSQRMLSTTRQFVVEADSVFGSEVSSKPHFPSSASNYTDSKTSDFLSSIREVSGSFYFSATSGQNASEFNEVGSAGPSEERSKHRHTRQRGLRKQFVSEAQLLSGDEDWI